MSLIERIVSKVLMLGNRRFSDASTVLEFDVGLAGDNPKMSVLAGQDYFRCNVNYLFEQNVEVAGDQIIDGTLDVTGALDVTGTAIFRGNLEVQGTQTYLNTNDLQVEDKNIQLNYGSTTLNAEGAGFDVLGNSNASLARMLYDSTLPYRFKLGPTGSEKAVLVTGEVRNADIASDAAIAGTKLAMATASVQGAYKPGATPGYVGSAAIAAGMVGQRLYFSYTNVTTTSNSTWTRSGTKCLTLPPGVWLISVRFFTVVNTMSGADSWAARITSGASVGAVQYPDAYTEQVHVYKASSSAANFGTGVAYIHTDVSLDLWLEGYTEDTVGTVQLSSSSIAVRIA